MEVLFMAEASKHGKNRTKERLGLSKKDADKNAQKALENGISHAECKGNLKRYIDKLCLQQKKGCKYRVYHRYIYCFDTRTDVLITVMSLPQNLYKLADTLQKKKDEK